MSIVTLNDRAVRSVSAFGSVNAGSMIFISKVTASSSATIDFTSGIDSTYKEYVFTFNNIEPATDGADFSFQVETGTNSDYNQTITSSYFRAYHHEADSAAAIEYVTGKDLAQSTNFQVLAGAVGNGADGNMMNVLLEKCTCLIHHLQLL